MDGQSNDALVKLTDQVDEQTQGRAGSPEGHPEFERLVRTIWRLRQPDGCPWDKVQTHDSIARNMIEEAYEAVDAIVAHDDTHLREELGDVLMQVLLHAQIAADEGAFDIDDVCRELNQKLVRRHPHVFGNTQAHATSAGEVLDIWDEVKRSEREAQGEQTGEEPGLLDSVPSSLPALMQAQKISKRAAKAGFDWDTSADVWDKVHEEVDEFSREETGTHAAAEEFGDVLFSLVNVARKEHIDAEEALSFANHKFRQRWKAMERIARDEGIELEQCTAEQYDELWNRAKSIVSQR